LYTSEVVGTYRADLQLAGRGGVPDSGVAAVIANVTATNATAPGFVTVYPAATNQPLASNLNVDHVGQSIPNLAVARLGFLGRASLYSLTSLDLLFDVAGWFTGNLTPPDPGVPTNPPIPPPPTTTTRRHHRATTDYDCAAGYDLRTRNHCPVGPTARTPTQLVSQLQRLPELGCRQRLAPVLVPHLRRHRRTRR
jgi:hypothetical protein